MYSCTLDVLHDTRNQDICTVTDCINLNFLTHKVLIYKDWMINIQFIDMDDNIYVIEVNPRSSRTVPYISKVTGIPIVDLAARIIMGETIKGMGYTPGLAPTADYIAIKMPVFSFEKLRGAEISLGPEMKSTGECLGIDKTFNGALYKAFEGAGVELPKYKQMIMTVKDADVWYCS